MTAAQNPVPTRALDFDAEELAPLASEENAELWADVLQRLNEFSDDVIDYLVAFDRQWQRYQSVLGAQAVARARITTNGSGGATVVEGVNIEQARPSGGNLVVDLAIEMRSKDYAVVGIARNGGGVIVSPLPLGFTTRTFVLDFDSDTGSDVDPATTALEVHCMVFGARA